MYKHSLIFIISMCVMCLTFTPIYASDSAERKMKAYPNPIERNAQMTIEIPDNRSEMTVILYNTVGREVQRFRASNNKITFYAPDISGVYLLRFIEKQKVVAVEKIVVKQ